MPDTQDLKVSQKDFAGYFIALQRANLIKEGIEKNTAPFLPQNFETVDDHTFVGKLTPQIIINVNSGMPLAAKEMIPAILLKEKNGYASNVVGTYGTAQKASTVIKQGEKGVGHLFKGEDGENHSANYYFPEQMEHPDRFIEFAQGKQKWEQRLVNETIKIDSPEVTDYLGAYIAACKSGAKIEVSPEVAEQFKQNMLAVADNELKYTNAEKNPNIPKLNDLLFTADKKANELVKAIEKERGLAPEKQQQKKNEYKRDKGMER